MGKRPTSNDEALAIGVDIGGTTTRIGLVDPRGELLEQDRVATQTMNSAGELLARLVADAERLFARRGRSRRGSTPVGIAVPGLLDERRERVRRCVNVPWLEGVPLRDRASLLFESPVCIMTDAEAATWGEYRAHGNPPGSFVHLRLGTGVALGVIENGTLLDLNAGRTEHLPELVVDRTEQALVCPCGLRGCLETVASGRALRERLHPAVDSHDTALLDEIADWIIVALQNIATRRRPDHIVIGGGVIQSHPMLFESVRDRWSASFPGPGGASASVTKTLLGDDAGAVGAGLLALSTCGAAAIISQ